MILEAMRPYKTMLQLGTNVYSQGKAQKVRYNDIIENIKMYDREMFSTNMRVYFKVKKKFGNQENAINAMFLNRQGLIAIDNNKSLQPRHFKDVFGGFQNSLRPNLSQGGTNIANLLPFEQSMSFIAAKINQILV